MVSVEENILFGIVSSWILRVWFTYSIYLNCLFESRQLVEVAELLILLLFSSSQAEELLILVHIEFNIVAVEFIIVVLLYLDFLLIIQHELLIW